MEINPYTCRLLIRIDGLIYRMRGHKLKWSKGGHLCRMFPSGSGVEIRSHFPGWMFRAACWVQNRWFWTRKILSV